MAVGDKPDTIFAEPTCSTGSIGVMIPHYDISGLMERFDVKDDSLATHPRKLMLSMTTRADARRAPQDRPGAHQPTCSTRFKDIIKEGRPDFKDDPADLDKLATGEIFTADQALEHKLIDKIGFVEDAIDRALELASLKKDNTLVVKYKRPATLFGDLGVAEASSRAGLAGTPSLAQLLDLAAPRGWYLATSLPAIITARRADQRPQRRVWNGCPAHAAWAGESGRRPIRGYAHIAEKSVPAGNSTQLPIPQ